MRRPRGEEHEVLRPVLGGAEERRRGMTGDLPCNAPCANAPCRYNADGLCADNCPCEERLPRPESDDYETENTQEDN